MAWWSGWSTADDEVTTRFAWFTPAANPHSGVAAEDVALLPRLGEDGPIDLFVDALGSGALPAASDRVRLYSAHEFVWRHARRPYDLIVYHLANTSACRYMWGYVVRYPGLAVLYEDGLHHMRAEQLIADGRLSDYRAELEYDRPDLPAALHALAPLQVSHLLHESPLVRPILATSRLTVARSERLRRDLEARYPGYPIDVLRQGVADPLAEAAPPRDPGRPITIAAFGRVSSGGGTDVVLRAFSRLRRNTPARLRLVGPPDDDHDLRATLSSLHLDDNVDRVGDLAGDALCAELRTADVCLCLRPTPDHATSTDWIRCLAAGKPTVATLSRHLSVPMLDPWAFHGLDGGEDEAAAVAVDPLAETESLYSALRRLASRPAERDELGRRARAYWSRTHTLDMVGADYRRVLEAAQTMAPGAGEPLPSHFRRDTTEHARELLSPFGVGVDVLRQNGANVTAGLAQRT